MSDKELPYKKENAPDGSFSIVNNKGVAIAKTWNPEDADFICLCCNSHKVIKEGRKKAEDRCEELSVELANYKASHKGLMEACKAIANLSQHGDIMASLYGSGALVAQCQKALKSCGD